MYSFAEYCSLQENAGQFGYRAVPDYAIVKRKGLTPDFIIPYSGSKTKGLYFANNEDAARKYGNILIKFALPHDTTDDPQYHPEYYISYTPIPPNLLYVKTDDTEEYLPILSTKMIQNHIVSINQQRIGRR